MLSAEDLRKKAGQGLRVHVVPVGAWDGESVLMTELDGLQIQEWDNNNAERTKDPSRVLELGTGAEDLVRRSLIVSEEDRTLVFPGREGIKAVRSLGGALQELYGHALRINRLLIKDGDEAKKNSSKTLSSDSGSTSPIDGDAQ